MSKKSDFPFFSTNNTSAITYKPQDLYSSFGINIPSRSTKTINIIHNENNRERKLIDFDGKSDLDGQIST